MIFGVSNVGLIPLCYRPLVFPSGGSTLGKGELKRLYRSLESWWIQRRSRQLEVLRARRPRKQRFQSLLRLALGLQREHSHMSTWDLFTNCIFVLAAVRLHNLLDFVCPLFCCNPE